MRAPSLGIFRVRIGLPGLPRFAYIGLAADIFEATAQARADWPEARSIHIHPVIQLTPQLTGAPQ